MNLNDKKIILVGACGGIGVEVSRLLVSLGAYVVLVDKNQACLDDLLKELLLSGENLEEKIITIASDISVEKDRREIIAKTLSNFGEIGILINLAGLMSFTQFELEDPETTELLFKVNVLAPMHLSRMVVPHMVEKGSGQIVNIGSIFGSISFAWFATYSSTKFALRGFSEALRRELDGTGVKVNYIAPRAVKTPFNSDSITQMCEHLNTKMDPPFEVAKDIVNAIQNETKDKYLGFPEKIFVRINALFPRLVDKVLKKQNQEAKKFIK